MRRIRPERCLPLFSWQWFTTHIITQYADFISYHHFSMSVFHWTCPCQLKKLSGMHCLTLTAQGDTMLVSVSGFLTKMGRFGTILVLKKFLMSFRILASDIWSGTQRSVDLFSECSISSIKFQISFLSSLKKMSCRTATLKI